MAFNWIVIFIMTIFFEAIVKECVHDLFPDMFVISA